MDAIVLIMMMTLVAKKIWENFYEVAVVAGVVGAAEKCIKMLIELGSPS